MNNQMAVNIAAQLNDRGIPFEITMEDNGKAVFVFDDRMIASETVQKIFEQSFYKVNRGWVEAVVSH